MIVGVPREIKTGEQRVALTPAGAHALRRARASGAGRGDGRTRQRHPRRRVRRGRRRARHEGPGVGRRRDDHQGQGAVASRIPDAARRTARLHVLPPRGGADLARELAQADVIAIAYETVERSDGSLPLLTPMSEVAGRLAVQEGAFYLGRAHGAAASSCRAFPAFREATWSSSAAGTVGLNAAKAAVGSGADVSVLDVNLDRLRHLGRSLRRTDRDAGFEQLQDRSGDPARRPAHGRRVDRRRAGARSWSHEAMVERMKTGGGDRRCRGGSRRFASRRSIPRRSTIPSTRWRAWSTTASPTCRPSSRARRPSPWPTPPSLRDRAVRSGAEGGRPSQPRAGSGSQRVARPVRAPRGGRGPRRVGGTPRDVPRYGRPMTRSVRSWTESATVERVAARPVGHRINHRLRRRSRMDCGPVTGAVIVRGVSRP